MSLWSINVAVFYMSVLDCTRKVLAGDLFQYTISRGGTLALGKGRLFSKLVLPSIRAISLDTQILPAVHPACANSMLNFQVKVDLVSPSFKLFS